MRDRPWIAPYESCVACYRGDVTTAFVVEGEAEFIVDSIAELAGISYGEAVIMVLRVAEHQMDCEPGAFPPGSAHIGVRLCRSCAATNGTTIVPVADVKSGDPFTCYVEVA